MAAPVIYDWQDISEDFGDTILLGNGSSIAIDERFRYQSLLEQARARGRIPVEVDALFKEFGTNDWEFVLRTLQIASTVNRYLGVEDDSTRPAYTQTQRGLFEVVREIHIEHDEARPYFERIVEFLSQFYTVLSLNYDLIVYWAALWSNEYLDLPAYFKDCFAFYNDYSGQLDNDWPMYYEPHAAQGNKKPVVLWYPHGNLALVSTLFGRDRKVTRPRNEDESADLLDAVAAEWERADQTPLLVAEGGRLQKENAIARSDYLRTVFNDVIPRAVKDDVVFYGFNMDDNDDHIITQLLGRKTTVTRLAFSLHTDGDKQRWMATQRKVEDKVRLIGEQAQKKIEVKFFHATSEGAWIYPKEV